MNIFDRIKAVDITYHCDGCKEPMKMTFAVLVGSVNNFELIKCYCPRCVQLELDKD